MFGEDDILLERLNLVAFFKSQDGCPRIAFVGITRLPFTYIIVTQDIHDCINLFFFAQDLSFSKLSLRHHFRSSVCGSIYGTLALVFNPHVSVNFDAAVTEIERRKRYVFQFDLFGQEPPIAVVIGTKQLRGPSAHGMVGCNDKAGVTEFFLSTHEGSPGSFSDVVGAEVLVAGGLCKGTVNIA